MHTPHAATGRGTSTPTAARLSVTALVALTEAAHLGWEHVNGGIVRHHLLADPSLPSISNAWGLLVLPALAWIASSRLFRRDAGRWRLHRAPLLSLASALLAGGALSLAFSFGLEDASFALLIGLLLSALVARAYRAEYLLGFVLGMTCTFGAVLPTMIGGCIALLSAGAWRGAWPLLGRVASRVRA